MSTQTITTRPSQPVRELVEKIGTTEAEILHRIDAAGYSCTYGMASCDHYIVSATDAAALVASYADFDPTARFLTDESCRKVAVHVVENNGKWAADSDFWEETLLDCLEFVGCGGAEATVADRELIESLMTAATITVTLPGADPEK